MADNPRVDDLRRRVQLDPTSIAFAQLAEELRRAGQCEEAVQVCLQGLGKHPAYLSARVTLGRALLELGQLDEARRELDIVLTSAPENLAALRGLAEIYHRQGAEAEALARYKAALALARNDPDLEQIVADLERAVAPARTAPVNGLSLEEMSRELSDQAGPAPGSPGPADSSVAAPGGDPVPAPVPTATAAVESAPGGPESGHDARTIGVLENWLAAIHGTRSERHS
jgi:tetratricopeptide (TPR) repeat protein